MKPPNRRETPSSCWQVGTFSSGGTGIDRREFLGAWGTAGLASPSLARAVAGAREIIGAGAIGSVIFCRAASPGWAAVARRVCGNSAVIVEVDVTAGGAVLLGSAATLVLDREGCRLLP